MTAPAKRVSARVSGLPEPDLVSLVDGDEKASESGWWTEYGGIRDAASGVIAFPPNALPPCSVANCQRCARKQGA
jgi:hypothetical protein